MGSVGKKTCLRKSTDESNDCDRVYTVRMAVREPSRSVHPDIDGPAGGVGRQECWSIVSPTSVATTRNPPSTDCSKSVSWCDCYEKTVDVCGANAPRVPAANVQFPRETCTTSVFSTGENYATPVGGLMTKRRESTVFWKFSAASMQPGVTRSTLGFWTGENCATPVGGLLTKRRESIIFWKIPLKVALTGN